MERFTLPRTRTRNKDRLRSSFLQQAFALAFLASDFSAADSASSASKRLRFCDCEASWRWSCELPL
eukprot:10053390-Alexandrium_andersonii.AAC.1